MANWAVKADFDPDARVWYVTQSNVPGLAVDADTIDALERKIGPMLLDLIEIHAGDLTAEQIAGPHRVHIVAHHEHDFRVAA